MNIYLSVPAVNEDVWDVFPCRAANAFTILLCERPRRSYKDDVTAGGATLGQVADWWRSHPNPRSTMLMTPNFGVKSLKQALYELVLRGFLTYDEANKE